MKTPMANNDENIFVCLFESTQLYAIGFAFFLKKVKNISFHVTNINTTPRNFKRNTLGRCNLALYHVPNNQAINATARDISNIKKYLPGASIILFSNEFCPFVIQSVFSKGVKAYFLLNDDSQEIEAVIRKVLAGQVTLSSMAMQNYLQYKANHSSPLKQFSSEEQKALQLFASGHSSLSIKTELSMKPLQWQLFVSGLLTKMNCLN
jgi:DNA-binding NarL/FixJ family response regulator